VKPGLVIPVNEIHRPCKQDSAYLDAFDAAARNAMLQVECMRHKREGEDWPVLTRRRKGAEAQRGAWFLFLNGEALTCGLIPCPALPAVQALRGESIEFRSSASGLGIYASRSRS
jgi:hypothetical protein